MQEKKIHFFFFSRPAKFKKSSSSWTVIKKPLLKNWFQILWCYQEGQDVIDGMLLYLDFLKGKNKKPKKKTNKQLDFIDFIKLQEVLIVNHSRNDCE